MNPAIAAQWSAALRSGEYKQIRGRLRTDAGMCCLGVLCDVHSSTHPGVGWSPPGRGETEWVYMNNTLITPRQVEEWADLKDWTKLGDLNDKQLYKFSMIADYIDRHVADL